MSIDSEQSKDINSQNIGLAVMNEQLKNISNKLTEIDVGNNQDHRDIFDNMARKADLYRIVESQKGRISMLQKDVDIHCTRINNLKKELAIFQEIFKPTKNFVDNVQDRIFYGFFALLALLGAIIYAAFNYFNKK